jgi:signal transduction histidine kinase
MLTGLDGGMYLMETGLAEDKAERVEAGWENLKTIVGRIRKLVHNILFFAKERELKRDRVDVLNFVEDVASTVEPKINANGITFLRDFDTLPAEIEIDAGIVRLALINILDNALDACAEDDAGKHHKIVFGAKGDDNQIRFEIKDNGIGMDRETRESLFTLFFSSKGNKGTGLGLFIAHKIIDQHGGKIAVESRPARGATFTITIPGSVQNTNRISKEKKE